MNTFSKFLPLIPILIIVFELIYYSQNLSQSQFTPKSSRNYFINQLTEAIQSSSFKINNLEIRDFQDEVELNLEYKPERHTFQLIIPLKSEPVKQITVLQKLFEAVNIKGKDIKIIDLASNPPYATF